MNELEVLKNSLNISIWMLCITLFVSVSTIAIGAINMAFQRSHNRKSVKPFCNIHKTMERDSISISIMNAGLGPMIIQRIVLLNKPDDAPDNGVPLSDILPSGLKYDKVLNHNDSYILSSMGEMILLQYTGIPGNKKSTIDMVKNSLKSLYLCIVFKDIYDRTYEKKESLNFEN
jgi:hypothetical protein